MVHDDDYDDKDDDGTGASRGESPEAARECGLLPPGRNQFPAHTAPVDQCGLFVRRACFHFCLLQGGGRRVAGGSRGGEGNLLSGRKTAGGNLATLLFERKLSLSDLSESPPTILQGGMMGQLSPVGSDSFIYHLSRTPSLQIYPP